MAVGKWNSNLQFMIDKADASLLNVIDDSVIGQLLAIDGTVSDFNDNTDSLEAISNAVGSIPTDDLAAVIGALNNAAATGAVTDTDTLVAYIKQLVTASNLMSSQFTLQGTSPNTSGTANTSTRIELDSNASSVDGTYDPGIIVITSGTGDGQARQIWEYDGTNKYAYVNRDWKVIPDDTSEYALIANSGNSHVNEGLARGGTNNTITLNALASDQNSLYLGQMIFIAAGTGADQARMVVGYNGTSKVATVDANWIVNPDATSVYAMYPNAGFVEATATVDGTANVLLRDVIGNKSDAAATGTVTTTESLMAYAKQNVNSNILQESGYILTGTSPDTSGTANTSTRIELDSNASSTNGAYDPAIVIITGGTGAGQARQIFEYDGANKYAYVNRDWKVIPDDTSTYTIMADAGDTHVNEGLAQGGSASTITLNSLASSDDDIYNEHMVFIVAGTGADQARRVIDYNGTTKVATVDYAWVVNPDATSVYSMLPSLGAGAALNIPQFVGTIAYADADAADDTANGLTPLTPKKTINAALAVAGVAGAVSVKAGTYTEDVVMSLASQELWCEIGMILAGTGTCLTVSGNYCSVHGKLSVNASAGQIGILVSGDNCDMSNCTIISGATGLHVTGDGFTCSNMAAGLQTSYGYNFDGDRFRIQDSFTVGVGASIGYNVGNAANVGNIKNCSSTNHQTSSITIETGCTNITVLNCSSGGGDGRWVDVDRTNVWSNFVYDDIKMKTQTFTAAGPASVSLFTVTGSVLITEIYGKVDTVLAGDVGNLYLNLYDGTNTVDITDSPGPSFNSLPVGPYAHKIDDAGTNIKIENSSQVRLYEDSSKYGVDPNFQVTAKNGATTYIRSTYSGSGASGAIHWHVKWEPLTHDGWVAAV